MQSLSRSHDSETSQNLVLRQFLPEFYTPAHSQASARQESGEHLESLLLRSLRGAVLSLKPREEVSSC